MRHKSAILDGRTTNTGSYKWTVESGEETFGNLVILHDKEALEAYRREVELLGEQAADRSRSGVLHCSV